MGDYGGFPAPQPFAGDPTTKQSKPVSRRLDLGAKDPLMKKAKAKVKENKKSREELIIPDSARIMQLAGCLIYPLIVFVLVLFTTTFMFYNSPGFVMLVATTAVLVCFFQYMMVEHCTRKKAGKWKKWLGVLGAAAAVAGLLAGQVIHYNWMLYYFKYTNMMKYSNVAASQPALQFEDAGSILFTEGTTVDRTRAVGYRNIRTSETLCVAPVVDGQMAATDEIVFFAVGVNCCGWRASFTCDDAVSGGRGALIMLEPDQLVSPAMEWAVDDHFNFQAFEKAIDLQKSVFAVAAAKNHRLVRWVKEPLKAIDHYRKRGLEAALLTLVAYVIMAALFVVFDLVKEARRQAAQAKAFMSADAGAFA